MSQFELIPNKTTKSGKHILVLFPVSYLFGLKSTRRNFFRNLTMKSKKGITLIKIIFFNFCLFCLPLFLSQRRL